jgi:hypothetical protein
MLYELDQLEYSGLAINQMLKVIRIMILIQMNYLFSNGFILNRQAEIIDKRIRRLIYNFTKDKTVSKAYIYTSLEYGGLGIAEAKMEMHAYRIYHVDRLLLKNEGQRIMKEYFNLQGEKISKFLSLSESLEHSLKEVSLNWDDWERFKGTPDHFIKGNEMLYKEFDESKGDSMKPKGNSYFLFEDAVSQEKYSGRVSRIHKTVKLIIN